MFHGCTLIEVTICVIEIVCKKMQRSIKPAPRLLCLFTWQHQLLPLPLLQLPVAPVARPMPTISTTKAAAGWSRDGNICDKHKNQHQGW